METVEEKEAQEEINQDDDKEYSFGVPLNLPEEAIEKEQPTIEEKPDF